MKLIVLVVTSYTRDYWEGKKNNLIIFFSIYIRMRKKNRNKKWKHSFQI